MLTVLIHVMAFHSLWQIQKFRGVFHPTRKSGRMASIIRPRFSLGASEAGEDGLLGSGVVLPVLYNSSEKLAIMQKH
jgi:hypothetical protein